MLHTPSDVHTPSGVPSQDSGDASPFPETSCPGDLVPGAPGWVPIPDRRLGSLLAAGSRAAPPPPAPSQGGSFGLCQSITKREVTSPSQVPPCPRPAYPLPLAAPENMTHPGWGREPSPGVLSPNQAEWAQAALFPTPAPHPRLEAALSCGSSHGPGGHAKGSEYTPGFSIHQLGGPK